MQLEEFLESGRQNAWLEYPLLSVYVRRGHHLLQGRLCRVFDIANAIVDEEFQGQGTFTSWFNHAEEIARQHFEGVFCESVINTRLYRFYERRGYQRDIRPGLGSTNYFKLFG